METQLAWHWVQWFDVLAEPPMNGALVPLPVVAAPVVGAVALPVPHPLLQAVWHAASAEEPPEVAVEQALFTLSVWMLLSYVVEAQLEP